MNSGIHYQYLQLNNDQVIEPRWGLKWSFAKGQSLSLGYGRHSQIQVLPMYLIATKLADNTVNTNKNLKFNKSNQFVLSYSLMISANTAFKAESYYQYLYDIPVTMAHVPSSFSAVNEGMSYIFTDFDSLVNNGTGRNYGIELTLERFFSKSYYYLVTASIFDSKYRGSDGIFRNTAFNGRYVFNTLLGKEFKINAKSKFLIDIKFTTAGGKRYTPINSDASKALGVEVRNDENAYSEQFKNYFRTDLKLTYRINTLGAGHEFFINIDNLFNTKYVFSQVYNADKNQLSYIYQLGIFPTFQYKIYF
jgi:hypothetical protein